MITLREFLKLIDSGEYVLVVYKGDPNLAYEEVVSKVCNVDSVLDETTMNERVKRVCWNSMGIEIVVGDCV